MFMYMPMDWYFILVLPAFILSIIASISVKKTFKKYDQMLSESNHTGAFAARKILEQNGLNDVKVVRVPGELTDHYNPRTNELGLSDSTYSSTSVAAIGVAAHEAGHAIQSATSYIPNTLRAVLVPAANIG